LLVVFKKKASSSVMRAMCAPKNLRADRIHAQTNPPLLLCGV
jgi:hypothetical protein